MSAQADHPSRYPTWSRGVQEGFLDGSRFRLGQRGSVLVFVGVSLVALLGLAALSLDVGRMVIAKQRAQEVVDAAVLAGAYYLTGEANSTQLDAFSGLPSSGDGIAARISKWTGSGEQRGVAAIRHADGYEPHARNIRFVSSISGSDGLRNHGQRRPAAREAGAGNGKGHQGNPGRVCPRDSVGYAASIGVILNAVKNLGRTKQILRAAQNDDGIQERSMSRLFFGSGTDCLDGCRRCIGHAEHSRQRRLVARPHRQRDKTGGRERPGNRGRSAGDDR